MVKMSKELFQKLTKTKIAKIFPNNCFTTIVKQLLQIKHTFFKKYL